MKGIRFLYKMGLIIVFMAISIPGFSQSFTLVPLGVHGGGQESNLSAYLLGETGTHHYICLDAGTLRFGIKKAIANGVFQQDVATVLQKDIKAYFISHGHLDHLAGLIINSPYDSPKNIYAAPFVINILKKYYFTNGPWINFANQGSQPQLGVYTYKPEPYYKTFAIAGTKLTGKIFPLSHGNPYKSSAILVTNPEGESVLYLGDTGADRIEKSHCLENLWTAVAPLVRTGKLKAILIETSFPNSHPENKLFGHLTPKLLTEELQVLAQKVGVKTLPNLKIVVTHLKPGKNQIEMIKEELLNHNPLRVQYIFPQQGKKIIL